VRPFAGLSHIQSPNFLSRCHLKRDRDSNPLRQTTWN
jgi:hypothetical protein